jgi:hypothetical protein
MTRWLLAGGVIAPRRRLPCWYRGRVMQHETMDATPAGSASPVVAAGDSCHGEA